MCALPTSIRLRTYLPKINNEILYYTVISYFPRYHGAIFSSKYNLSWFGTIYDANLEIMSCQIVFYQALHTHAHQDPKHN